MGYISFLSFKSGQDLLFFSGDWHFSDFQQIENKCFVISLDEEVPLPEDTELRCFQPIEKAHR